MKTKKPTTRKPTAKARKPLPFLPPPVVRISRAMRTYRMGSRWSFVQVNGVDKRQALKAYAMKRAELPFNGRLPETPQVCELLR